MAQKVLEKKRILTHSYGFIRRLTTTVTESGVFFYVTHKTETLSDGSYSVSKNRYWSEEAARQEFNRVVENDISYNKDHRVL